ncbi:MAG: hypothetical protein Kow0068_10070 [Marinilabiliales bacterium]
MKEIIIFNQWAGDIPYVLSVYEQNVNKSLITIINVGTKSNYIFFSSLNLKLKALKNVPHINMIRRNDLCSPFKAYFYTRIVYKKLFKNIKKADIYYFTNSHGWITLYFIHMLQRYGNNIYFKKALLAEVIFY